MEYEEYYNSKKAAVSELMSEYQRKVDEAKRALKKKSRICRAKSLTKRQRQQVIMMLALFPVIYRFKLNQIFAQPIPFMPSTPNFKLGSSFNPGIIDDLRNYKNE